MGHSTHFLERLNRVKPWHTEVALALYRDPKFLKYLLSLVRVPAGAERVALCLDDAAGGPHLIVTRGGDFVTCLGEGMAPYDVFHVAQAELESVRDFRQSVDVSLRALADGSEEIIQMGGGDYFLKRLMRGAHTVNRADMLMLRKLSPLISQDLILSHSKLHVQMSEMRRSLVGHLKTRQGRRAVLATCGEMLRDYWCHVWAHNHITTLFGCWSHALRWEVYVPRDATLNESLRAERERYGDGFYQAHLLTTALWTAARSGVQLQMIRASWGVAHVMPLAKVRLLDMLGESFQGSWTLTIKNLLAVIMHVQLLADEEVAPFLDEMARATGLGRAERDGTPLLEPGDASPSARFCASLFNTATAMRRIEDEALDALIRANQRERITALMQRSASAAEAARELLESLSDEDAFVHTMLTQPPIKEDSALLEGLMIAAVIAARRQHPEQLYFEDTTSPLWESYSPEQVLQLLDDDLLRAPKAPLQHRQPQPGRNEPCPCGSGKKYKKCCQREGEA